MRKLIDKISAPVTALSVLVLVLALVAGCGYYQSQTTVFGVEVEYNPSSSVTPTARAGVITHRQNYARTVDMLHRMENSVDYYDVSLFTTTGTFHGRMIIEPPPKTANPPPPAISWWNPLTWFNPAGNLTAPAPAPATVPTPAPDGAKPAGESTK